MCTEHTGDRRCITLRSPKAAVCFSCSCMRLWTSVFSKGTPCHLRFVKDKMPKCAVAHMFSSTPVCLLDVVWKPESAVGWPSHNVQGKKLQEWTPHRSRICARRKRASGWQHNAAPKIYCCNPMALWAFRGMYCLDYRGAHPYLSSAGDKTKKCTCAGLAQSQGS